MRAARGPLVTGMSSSRLPSRVAASPGSGCSRPQRHQGRARRRRGGGMRRAPPVDEEGHEPVGLPDPGVGQAPGQQLAIRAPAASLPDGPEADPGRLGAAGQGLEIGASGRPRRSAGALRAPPGPARAAGRGGPARGPGPGSRGSSPVPARAARFGSPLPDDGRPGRPGPREAPRGDPRLPPDREPRRRGGRAGERPSRRARVSSAIPRGSARCSAARALSRSRRLGLARHGRAYRPKPQAEDARRRMASPAARRGRRLGRAQSDCAAGAEPRRSA